MFLEMGLQPSRSAGKQLQDPRWLRLGPGPAEVQNFRASLSPGLIYLPGKPRPSPADTPECQRRVLVGGNMQVVGQRLQVGIRYAHAIVDVEARTAPSGC